jgi:short-subunit dehydrogenase
VSIAGGDAPLDDTEAAFDRIAAINLRGAIMACKHVVPLMRAQRAGVIITISSVAAWEQYPNVVYKATKAGMIAFTQQVAIQNAEFGVRANIILPGLMDTPMAVDTRACVGGKSRAEVAAARDARVPLRHKMGTAWDVANAAVFLASDEANFITGVALRSMAALSSTAIELLLMWRTGEVGAQWLNTASTETRPICPPFSKRSLTKSPGGPARALRAIAPGLRRSRHRRTPTAASPRANRIRPICVRELPSFRRA